MVGATRFKDTGKLFAANRLGTMKGAKMGTMKGTMKKTKPKDKLAPKFKDIGRDGRCRSCNAKGAVCLCPEEPEDTYAYA